MLHIINNYYTVKDFLIDTSAFTLAGILEVYPSLGGDLTSFQASFMSGMGAVSMLIFVVARCVIIINKARISISEAKKNELEVETKKAELKNLKNE